MARELNDIYREILDAREADAYLESLDSDASETFADFIANLSASRVAMWKTFSFLATFTLWSFEKLDDVFRIEMDAIAETKQITTLRWYRLATLNFLFEKPVVWQDNSFKQVLEVGDDEGVLKVIKYCSVVKAPGYIKFKIASETDGFPSPSDNLHRVTLAAFLNQIKTAGDEIRVFNLSPDDLQLELDVYVDPLVINLDTGALHSDASIKPAEIAAQDYTKQIDFDGRFVTNHLIDKLQSAEGIHDIDLNLAKHRYGTLDYADIDVSVVSFGGYYAINSLVINYLPAEQL